MDSNLSPAVQQEESGMPQEMEYGNVFRRGMKDSSRSRKLAQHKLWLNTIQHEYPLPYHPYKIGVYIRFYNQTKYEDETYLEIRKRQFAEDIALCPRWQLVDFYVDYGMNAPRMDASKEWCRLLGDCFAEKVDLIVTQTVGGVSNSPEEMILISRILASQEHPVGIYFVSEDIFTLSSYYVQDIQDHWMLPEGWKALPRDELDAPIYYEVDPMRLESGSIQSEKDTSFTDNL